MNFSFSPVCRPRLSLVLSSAEDRHIYIRLFFAGGKKHLLGAAFHLQIWGVSQSFFFFFPVYRNKFGSDFLGVLSATSY